MPVQRDPKIFHNEETEETAGAALPAMLLTTVQPVRRQSTTTASLQQAKKHSLETIFISELPSDGLCLVI